MKRTLAFAVISAMACAVAVHAQTATAPSKIAVIQFQLAVTQTNEFQRNYADLQKKYDPKRQELQTLNTQIESLTKELQSQASTLSQEQQQSRAQAIQDKQRQAKRMQDDDQSDYQSDMQDMLNSMAQKVGAELQAYAREHGYTVVLDATQSQQQAPDVLYWNPATDITKAVVDAYNVKSGIPAPPPQAPAPTAAPKPAAPGATHKPATH
ncbi:MAG TPA: OmpH family outer membrane protein [Terracidiphilus sp.]|nr:OmpH family outer membrane protein [Terracidiphilus sp.]